MPGGCRRARERVLTRTSKLHAVLVPAPLPLAHEMVGEVGGEGVVALGHSLVRDH